IANRLWGSEGRVSIFFLQPQLYLVEFPSRTLRDWVFSRSWHVHHSHLHLRCWSVDIEPIPITHQVKHVWISLQNVPLLVCTAPGIGRLASMVGPLVSRFTRVGTMVTTCVLLARDTPRPLTLEVSVAGLESLVLVEYLAPRTYSQALARQRMVPQKQWHPKKTTTSHSSGNDS
ncbi:hypothetical protein LINGRAHAP2_LOCUS31764, partial [Linum grandiflorum]